MADLRAGLLGLGMMGRHHARLLRSLEGVRLAAVADPGGDPHGVAGDLPVGRGVEDLVAAGVDYVVVATPTRLHEQIALQLADAGVHALVEKPVAQDVAAARRMSEAFERAGLVGAVGHIERYNPALRALRARLDAGELGDVYQIVTRRQGPFPARIADVGVVMDLATHDIDLTSWIAGGVDFASVSAHTAHRSGRSHEDLVSFVGRLESGVVTNHLVNWLSPMKERLTVVTGERGAFVADTVTADLTFFANGTDVTPWVELHTFRGVTEGDVIRYALRKVEPLRAEHEAFRDAVLGRTPLRTVTLADGLRTVSVAEAVLRSARAGGAVEVPTIDPAG